MKKLGILAAVIASLLLIFPAVPSPAEAPSSGPVRLKADTAVYADPEAAVLLGTLCADQTVWAEEWDAGGRTRIVYLYPLLLCEGWIDADGAVLLEGEALEEYLYGAGEDGMRYKNFPLLPVSFVPAGEAGDGVSVDRSALPETEGSATAEASSAPLPAEASVPAPAILTQPTDQKGRTGQTVTFTVGAERVVSYRWQFHNGRVWKDATMPGCDGPAMEVEVSQKRYGYMYRCILTFADGTVLFSDEAGILKP